MDNYKTFVSKPPNFCQYCGSMSWMPSCQIFWLPIIFLAIWYSVFWSQTLNEYLLFQNFYKEMGREEIYIRYIYHLAELHNASSNWVEAGFTLLLHAQLLQVRGSCSYIVTLCVLTTAVTHSGLSQCRSWKVPILVSQVLNVKRLYTMTLLTTLIKERLV